MKTWLIIAIIHNLSSCEIKVWKKKFKPERDSNPWPLRYWCSALITLWVCNLPGDDEECKWINETSYIWTVVKGMKTWLINHVFKLPLPLPLPLLTHTYASTHRWIHLIGRSFFHSFFLCSFFVFFCLSLCLSFFIYFNSPSNTSSQLARLSSTWILKDAV